MEASDLACYAFFMTFPATVAAVFDDDEPIVLTPDELDCIAASEAELARGEGRDGWQLLAELLAK